MEDLYDDLDNYDQVNAVQELRNENMELKVKLEEHAAAMEKLQKQILQDYDNLEMEFKKLENNYSSLLKTARSEIQRKTQRITQLNTEKDMMVLNAIKNGKNIKRNFNKSVPNTRNLNNDKPNKWIQNKKARDDDAKLKDIDAKNERSDTNTAQTTKKAPSSVIDSSDFINKFDNAGNNKKKSYNTKENIPHEKTELNYNPKTLASSIRDRRKSMSAVSMTIEKFSSDEEHVQHYVTKDNRTDLPLVDKFERKNGGKIAIDRQSNKTSESSSIDDRGFNYYDSRDNCRGRSSKQNDNSSYRGRDKYEVYRKHYSPERVQKRQYREYKDDYSRQEQGRYRTLGSPPRESTSRYQRRNPDSRSNYDRHSYDNEKHRYRYEDKYSAKYKVSNDYNEPHSKKQKLDSFRNPDDHFMEDKWYNTDKESLDRQSILEYTPHEHNMLRLSCQSPDYVYNDAAFAHPIKEIMATAATPLEDPRVTSKRYVIKNDNGKEILSTEVGRNIDIKPINIVEWNIKPVNIPAALVRRPSQCSEDFVKDIYMDLDNPQPQLSTESGEVHFDSEDDGLGIPSNTKEIEDVNINKKAVENFLVQATDLGNMSNTSITKYKIPKIGHTNKNTLSKMDVPVIDGSKISGSIVNQSKVNVQIHESNMNVPIIDESMMDVPIIEMSENIPNNKDVSERNPAKDILSKKSLARQRQKDDLDHILPNSSSKHDDRSESRNQIELSKMAIVADDLELSDENSDNVDTQKQVIKEKIEKNSKVVTKRESTSKLETHTRHIGNPNETARTVDTSDMKSIEDEEKAKESDSAKKQKSKKKRSKSKEVVKDLIDKKDVPSCVPQATEKKIKSKKEKEAKPMETKQKFSDLFGDSSSLMTPEDLGIPTYLPIYEDAQDAVDMKINQIIDAPPLLDNVEVSDDRVKAQNSLDKKHEAPTHDKLLKTVLQTSNTEDKEIPKDIKKKKSSKRKEEILDGHEITPKVIYENLNTGTDSNEADVVKTVIISTGVQPELTFESNVKNVVESNTANVENTSKNVEHKPMPNVSEFKRHDILKALATSTPQKEMLTALNSSEADSIVNSNVSKSIDSRDNLPQVANQTDTNTLDSHDAPDVRIFVKRRRKLVKRPPMT